MVELRLTEEQARVLNEANGGSVMVLDADGKLLGHFQPEFAPAFLAELKRRGRGPTYTNEQMSRQFDVLEAERKKRGKLDEKEVLEILERLAQEDPPRMRPANP